MCVCGGVFIIFRIMASALSHQLASPHQKMGEANFKVIGRKVSSFCRESCFYILCKYYCIILFDILIWLLSCVKIMLQLCQIQCQREKKTITNIEWKIHQLLTNIHCYNTMKSKQICTIMWIWGGISFICAGVLRWRERRDQPQGEQHAAGVRSCQVRTFTGLWQRNQK